MKTNQALFAVDIVASLFELSFAVTLVMFFVTNVANMMLNRTEIQRWKSTHGDRDERCAGCKEIFGDGSICCYCFPTNAFGKDLPFVE